MRSPPIKHPLRVWVPAGVAVVGLAIGVLAATASVSSRSSLSKQLQQPASYAKASVGPGQVEAIVGSHPYRLELGLAPNRASQRDRLSLRLTTRSGPLNGARVTVSFSMPGMNMWDAFDSTLVQTANGTYTATEPVLGMPGMWRLRFHVAPRDAAAFSLAADDRMVR